MIKRLLSLALIFCMVVPVAAYADEVSERISVRYVEVSGDEENPTTVDTFNGIPAYYTEGEVDPYTRYSCWEFVQRYYAETYGVFAVLGYTNEPASDTYGELRLTKEAKVGDIVYWSPERRGKSFEHYALVKEVRENSIVLIEQNWKWVDNGVTKAGVEREIKYPSPDNLYDIWTYDGASINNVVKPEVQENPIVQEKPAENNTPQAGASNNDIKVLINEEALLPASSDEKAAFLHTDGKVYIQGRMLSEALGVAVEYHAPSKTSMWGERISDEQLALLSPKSSGEMRTTFDGAEGYIKDSLGALGAPIVVDGRTYFPLRALCEWLDCTVAWNGEERAVYVTLGSGNTHPELIELNN